MKVSNLDLQPDRTFRYRKLELDNQTAMRALVHKRTEEAILVTDNAVKFHPKPKVIQSWQELLSLPDPEEVTHKPVSSWAWLTGDNPFLILTSAGNPFPIEEIPGKNLDYEDARKLYTEGKQAALHSRGIAAAQHERMGLLVQGVLAAICVIGATITVFVLLPKVLERF